MANNTLTITDNRTAKKYEIPIEEGGVRPPPTTSV